MELIAISVFIVCATVLVTSHVNQYFKAKSYVHYDKKSPAGL